MRKLKADEIEVKVKQVFEKGVVALLYKTARVDMDMLDEQTKNNVYQNISSINSKRKLLKK